MITPNTRIPRADPLERRRVLPTLDRSFDAVDRGLFTLGVVDPGALRSPRPLEEILSPTALPEGTLLVLSPSETRAAEVDIEETVKDERAGGTLLVSLTDRTEFEARRRTLREIARSATVVCYAPPGVLPPSMGRLRKVILPEALWGYRFLVADTPGFRVALVSRRTPGGGFVSLWTGSAEVLAEAAAPLRNLAEAAGIPLAAPASPVPVLEGVQTEADVWRQAAELRAYRVVREAELREIARAAALKGVALRREREERERAAS
jgi:hypothetical protein